MRHTFLAISPQRFPVVGDLIRSMCTMQYINIVLETRQCGDFLEVRSVRYGTTNGGDFQLLFGQRSRLFKLSTKRLTQYYDRSGWQVVEEYTPCNNKALRDQIVSSLIGVNTSYRNPDGSENKPSDAFFE